jgi:hypothetical protein
LRRARRILRATTSSNIVARAAAKSSWCDFSAEVGLLRAEGEEMTPSEAKLRILAEWRTWVGHQQSAVSHTTAEALAFFKEIEQNKPDLLSFDSADKWEFVKGWLLNAGLIKP